MAKNYTPIHSISAATLLLRSILTYWLIQRYGLLLGRRPSLRWSFRLLFLLFYLLFLLRTRTHQIVNHPPKKVLNISTRLCWYLHIWVCLLLRNLLSHLPNLWRNLLLQVTLIPYDVNFDIVSSCLSDKVDPLVETLRWADIC